ncbi:MAG: nuclear transport factor 2 family protein [Burkholderiales bacterium]|jgi:ketosteroid isomerase-like protein|nr:nuclear transport factor 2 family protein [Burkholderiales bacterium]
MNHQPTQLQDLLKSFGEAFNRHDAAALVSMMTADCVFRTAMGDTAGGTAIVGREAVMKAFETTFANFPDARWHPRGPDMIFGDRGLSEWTFVATRASDGALFDMDGVDVFTFKDGLIAVKDAFRKDRPPTLHSN